MRTFLPVLAGAVLCAACGSSVSPTEAQKVSFERWSPPQATGHDVLLGSRGDVVVMAHRYSLDAGATWKPLDARLGEPTRVSIVGNTVALFANGLVRWNLGDGSITSAASVPSFATDRTWRVDPQSARFMAFDAVENAIAIESSANTWTTSKLPQPSSTETRPYIRDIESNGSVLLSASVWGVHRSTDGGSTWQLVVGSTPNAGRDLLVLRDGTFALVGGTTTYAFDAAGQAAGTLPKLVLPNEATVCEDGTIVTGTKLTRDLGATWETLIAQSDLQMSVQRASCGSTGKYWVLVISDAWGYRLVRFDAVGTPGAAAGNWEAVGDQAWTNGGPPILRTDDGTFLVAGLALAPNGTTWTLQEIPAKTWAAGTTLFGVAKQKFFASYDGGVTWSAAAANGLMAADPEAFAKSPDGALYVAQFQGGSADGQDLWRSSVWKTQDQGASWTMAYDAMATRVTGDDKVMGEVHRFVGITMTGDWIATDAVSRDAGNTWQKTTVLGDRGLAHLTRQGSLVTGGADEKVWRVYDDGGLGELRATYQIVVEGNAVPASQLRSVAFDNEGYAYIARGAPQVQIWRSDRPLE
ncbi:MAG TPA: hypothetical protein VMZ53_15555 [Kofleriaceae bacterium]|nr:hypothetical protein [Kofleriaceae bacterium]